MGSISQQTWPSSPPGQLCSWEHVFEINVKNSKALNGDCGSHKPPPPPPQGPAFPRWPGLLLLVICLYPPALILFSFSYSFSCAFCQTLLRLLIHFSLLAVVGYSSFIGNLPEQRGDSFSSTQLAASEA